MLSFAGVNVRRCYYMQVLRCVDVNVFKCYFMQVLRCVSVYAGCIQMLMSANADVIECMHKTIIFIYLQRYQYLRLLGIESQN